MKALIIGATGATGKDLLNIILKDTDYREVLIFVRRSSGIVHPKLKEILTDFDNLDAVAASIQGDVLFSCLGITAKIAGSKENQHHIDYEIPLHFSEIAKKNGVDKIVLLSAYGGSPTSKVFYSRLKGQLEEKTEGLAFQTTIIFKPGMLVRKNTERPAERWIAGVLKFFNGLGIAKKFKPLSTEILAEKMVKASKVLGPGKHIIELEKIFRF